MPHPLPEAIRQAERACASPFEAFTKPLIAYCSNWPGRADEIELIEDAKRALISQSIIHPAEFEGIDIRWCPLQNGSGVAADRNRIYLDPSFKGRPNRQIQISTLLAHEMKHIRQYVERGTDKFKCEYSRAMASCGGCQDRNNFLEAQAYEFEDHVNQTLRLSNKCQDGANICFGPQRIPVGWPCTCGGNQTTGQFVD